jgi:hypothetical protein
MPEYDLKQMKADLETIQAVAGISDGPARHDLLGSALVALAGVMIAGWAALSHGLWQICGLLALLAPVAYIIGIRIRHSRVNGGSPQVRQDFAAAGSVLLLAGPFVGYALWAGNMGIQPMLVLATTVFFVGVLVLNGVLSRPRHPELAPWCLALMAGALLLPSTAFSPITIIGFMLMAGGGVSAIVIGIRRRKEAVDGLPG